MAKPHKYTSDWYHTGHRKCVCGKPKTHAIHTNWKKPSVQSQRMSAKRSHPGDNAIGKAERPDVTKAQRGHKAYVRHSKRGKTSFVHEKVVAKPAQAKLGGRSLDQAYADANAHDEAMRKKWLADLPRSKEFKQFVADNPGATVQDYLDGLEDDRYDMRLSEEPDMEKATQIKNVGGMQIKVQKPKIPWYMRGRIKAHREKVAKMKVRDAKWLASQAAKKSDTPDLNESFDTLQKALKKQTVIGHTASGKPVHAHGGSHDGFSVDDHEEAAELHSDVASKLESSASRWPGTGNKLPAAGRKYLEEHAKHHRQMQTHHSDKASKMRQEKFKKEQAANKSVSAQVAEVAKSVIAEMQADKKAACTAHQFAAPGGNSGVNLAGTLTKSMCICDDALSKSAVAERVNDKLQANEKLIAEARALGIEVAPTWIESLFDEDEE